MKHEQYALSRDPSGRRPRDAGLSLAALVLAAVLPLLLFSLGVTYLFEQRERRQKEAEIIALSRAVSAAVTADLQSAASIAEILAASSSLDGDDLGTFHDAARRVLLTRPGLTAIFATDVASNVHLAHTSLPRLASNPGGEAARTEVPLVARTQRTMIFGVVPRGPIIAQPLIPIRAPVLRPDRPVERVVSVILLPGTLGAVFDSSGIPTHWTGTIVDAERRIAARNRSADQFVGRVVTPSLAEKMAVDPAGAFVAINQEGEAVFTTYTRSPDTGWSTVIGVPMSEVSGPARRAVATIASIGIAALVLGAGFAVALGRRIRRAREAERAFTRDLERSVAERTAQLGETERFTRAVLDALDARVVVLDQSGAIIAANQAWRRHDQAAPEANYLGLLEQAATGGDGDAAAMARGIRATIEGRQAGFVLDYPGRAPGEPRWFQCRVTRFPGDGPTRVVVAHEDISAVKAAQAELAEQIRRTQRMEAFGQMTGGIAHDFNNILGAIIGNLDLLDGTLAGRTDARALVDRAIDAAQRGAALTQRLLAFARKQMLQPQATDVNQLLDGMAPLLRRTLGANIGVDVALQPGLWPSRIDPGQLESAILNLAINAREAMADGGRLSIRTANAALERSTSPDGEDTAPGDYVMVSVTDNGPGMPPEVAHRAFEPFFTTKEVGQGTGLGLSMVYGFARQSGGSARLSSAPGAGTTVTLYLPRASSPQPRPDIDRPAPPPAAGIGHGILVVEDTELLRDFAVAALARMGYRPIPVGDGPAALAELDRGQDIALLLSDVVLPGGMDGFDIARAVARRMPELPILFMSGFTDQSVVPPDLAARGIKLLRKPFRAAQLAAAVAEALGHAAPG